MTQTIVTATAAVLAFLAAVEHLPRSLTRLVRACMPLARAWRELTGTTEQEATDQDPPEPEQDPRQNP
ncbi:hypothetical protein ABT040_37315 [Streptomyces sp. NPDC002688]|uniref:hypothetical protein n=1 Tax=Streptomyces sp. NPDC002688 TaxID=3154423 RepID=UPI0033244FF7